jgi:hypothetical protein
MREILIGDYRRLHKSRSMGGRASTGFRVRFRRGQPATSKGLDEFGRHDCERLRRLAELLRDGPRLQGPIGEGSLASEKRRSQTF